MTLEEVIKQRLAEANMETVVIKKEKKEPEPDEVGVNPDVIDMAPKKKSLTKESLDSMNKKDIESIDESELDSESKAILVEYKNKEVLSETSEKSTVSEQVSKLLEVEGLSEDFKEQAVTIFEAAIQDKVMVIEEKLKAEFDSALVEAKAEMDTDIDGFLSEAVQQWTAKNEVAIKANFNSQLAESFVDGVKALMAEHNIELPLEKENALEVALSEIDTLKESIAAFDAEKKALVEAVNEMKSEKILGSFQEKMTQTEFDRFSQLTESVKYVSEEQYVKQLNIVLENFGSEKKVVEKTIVESNQVADVNLISEVNSDVNQYANFIRKQLR